MNLFVNKLSMDLIHPQKRLEIYAVQGENKTRSVELTLLCDGKPWNVPDEVSLLVRYRKPDLKGGIYDTLSDGTSALSYNNNTITAILAPQMLTVPGTVLAQIELRKNDAILSTFTFHVVVESNPAADMQTSEDYVNMLQWLEEELDVYIQKFRESGELIGGTMQTPINMNGQALYGLCEPTQNDHAATMGYVNQQIRKVVPRNLLDNSDFRNPVNQRGKTIYNTVGYNIDRWKTYHTGDTAEIKDGYISVSARLYQVIPADRIDVSKTYTAAVMKTDGTLLVNVTRGISEKQSGTPTLYLSDQGVLFRPTVNGGDFVWAALYEGEYTKETLPEYRPKGYAAELAECQRYFQKYGAGLVLHYNGMSFTATFPFRMKMRTTPTVALSTGELHICGMGESDADVSMTGAALMRNEVSDDGAVMVCLYGVLSSVIGSGIYRVNQAESCIVLSADL